jgi:hypothetical protein
MNKDIENHLKFEDEYLGYDCNNQETNMELRRYRDLLLFYGKKKVPHIVIEIIKTDWIPHIAVLSDIFYLSDDSYVDEFIAILEIYIAQIEYPYTFENIKVIKNYKKMIKEYNRELNMEILIPIIEDDRKCKCVSAIRKELFEQYSEMDSISLINILDHKSIKDKFIIFNTLLKNEDVPDEIFKKETLYEKEFLIYLGILIYKKHEKDEDISKLIKYEISSIMNINSFVDFSLTMKSDTNRKLVNIPKIIKNLISQKISFSDLLLLRNLSRSVYLLRSEFLNYPITEIFLDYLSMDIQIENFYPEDKVDYSVIYDIHDINPKKLTKKIILNILTNLVLEYGNYRAIFIANNGFEIVDKYKEEYPLEILELYKNFLYDSDITHKRKFLRYKDGWYKFFFDMSDTEIHEMLFNLIRNLSCDKIFVSDYIQSMIFRFLKNCDSSSMLVHILYTLGNLSANDTKFRDRLLNDKDVIIRLKSLFSKTDLHLPLLWIIINLTWMDDGYEERAKALNDANIRENILNIETDDSDILDKINTALENLRN